VTDGKYTTTETCTWCGKTPAQVYPVEKRGTKEKRYAITVTACDECARRVGIATD
jgi:hypothetical protein